MLLITMQKLVSVSHLELRSCSPSPFGPSFAHRPREGTNSIAQCFWRSVSHPLATRVHGIAMVLDQGPVEAGVQRVRGCVPIRSRRASFKSGATWVDRQISSLKPRVVFYTVSLTSSDHLGAFGRGDPVFSSTTTLYPPPNGEATQFR